jgi:hypothetical protein
VKSATNIVHLGAISTGLVLTLGVAMIAPAFTQHHSQPPVVLVMLSFSIAHIDEKTSGWCKDLSSLLNERSIRATIFVTGEVAEANPECVRSFSSDVDIGSQGLSYVDLVALGDYTLALAEVEKGKKAVDRNGNLNSLVFRAPYGSTDENIYSLLSRTGMIADFSYVNHYNKYENDMFVRHDLKTLDGNNEGLRLFSMVYYDDDIQPMQVPIMVNFNSSVGIDHIRDYISTIASYPDVQFVNASELLGKNLTVRAGETSS